MQDKDVFEMISGCRMLIKRTIKKELMASEEKKVDLTDCHFPSYSLDDMLVETFVTSVYLKDNGEVWVDYEDDYTGKHAAPIDECFTVDEMLSIMCDM